MMINIKKQISILALIIGISSSASVYDLDNSHTNVGFSIKHMMISNVSGTFDNFSANLDFDAASNTINSFSATVSTASVDTDNAKRDKHLTDDDFFMSELYPNMTFKMDSYRKISNEEGILQGKLTIKEATKNVEFKVEEIATIKDLKGNNRVGFVMTSKISRNNFDLKWNRALEAGGVIVGDKVKILINVQGIEN